MFFDVNQQHIPNTDYLVVFDSSLYSGKDRFWLVDIATGSVEPHKVAHGDGSDADNNGYATCSATSMARTRVARVRVSGEIYDGTHAIRCASTDCPPMAARTAWRTPTCASV